MFLNAIEMVTLQETKHKKNKKEGHELFPKKDQINQYDLRLEESGFDDGVNAYECDAFDVVVNLLPNDTYSPLL